MTAKPAGEESTQFLQRECVRAGFQCDERLGGLPAIAVGDADDDAFGNMRMLLDRLLDGARVNVEAPLRIISFLRSVRETKPSLSMWPTSPVRNQPSQNEAAVSSGRFP